MSKLKPCPFCGWGTIVDMGGLFSHAAGCNACGAKTKNYKTWKEAVSDWNRRAQPANEPLTNTGGSFNGTGNVYNGTGPCGNICVGTGGGDSDANV